MNVPLTTRYRLTQWVGSKNQILEKLYEFFPKKYQTYIEPFGGSYSVVLNLPEIRAWSKGCLPKTKVPNLNVNDLDENIYALTKAFAFDAEELYKKTNYLINNENFREELRTIEIPEKDYLTKAFRYLYLLYTSFGGNLNRNKGIGNFGYRINKQRHTNHIYPNKDFVTEIRKRLSLINSFNRDWKIFLEPFKKKAKNAFVYFDPPYYHSSSNYTNSKSFNHFNLANYIKSLDPQHFKWLLSYDNCSEIKNLYSEYFIHDFEKTYSIANKGNIKGKELLISNYDPMNAKASKLNQWF